MAKSTTNPNSKDSLLRRIWAPIGMLISFPFSSRLQRYGRFNIWNTGLALLIVVATVIGYTSFHKSLHPSFDSREAKVVMTGSILDDFLTDDGKPIGSVRVGQQVELLAYGEGYFLIQTAEGERGWVEAAVIDKKFVVATSRHEEAQLGAEYKFVRYEGDNRFEMVATDASGKRHTFKKYDLFPTAAYGLPSLGLDDSFSSRYIYVTERWMAKHFAEGAEFDEMCKQYYGFPIVVDIVDSRTKNVCFPVRVKDFDTNIYHPKVTAHFVDGKLVKCTLTEDGKIPFVERYIPFGGRIASSRLFIKLRSRPFLVASKYDSVDDVISNESSRDLPGWVRIPLIVLLAFVGYIVLMAHLMVAPMLFHYIDRIPKMPAKIGEWSILVSLLISVIVLYMIYIPHWIILVLAFVLGFAMVKGLSVWEVYSHCPVCRQYYVLRTLGYGEADEIHYDEVVRHVTEEVTKRDGRVVDRKVVGSRDEVIHHKDIVQDEFIVCEHCKQKLVVSLYNGVAQGIGPVDEWPKPKSKQTGK
ncbi:MAG: hypothetical protein J6K24_02285 [Tidjanibacter sp.]|nr:hypothetical protein [Tidjanibacter sp.]